MLTCPPTEAGLKVEELRCALERSQALLAGLEALRNTVTGDECTASAGPKEQGSADASNGQDEQIIAQPELTPEGKGGITKLKSKLTQWLSGRRAHHAQPDIPAPAPARRLSFSRVNIEFPGQIPELDDPPAPQRIGLSSSPQLPAWRLQHSESSATVRRPSLPVNATTAATKRAVSFSAHLYPTYDVEGAAVDYDSAATKPSGVQPDAAEGCVTEVAAVPRRISFADTGGPPPQRRSSVGLVPTLSIASHQQQRRNLLRDTVWCEPRTAMVGSYLSPVTSLRNRQEGAGMSAPADFVSGVDGDGDGLDCAGAGLVGRSNRAGVAMAWVKPMAVDAVNTASLLPPLLQGTTCKSPPPPQQLHRQYMGQGGGSAGGNTHARPPPVPEPSSTSPSSPPLTSPLLPHQQQQHTTPAPPTPKAVASAMHARSFTLGAHPAALTDRGAAAMMSPHGLATYGSVGGGGSTSTGTSTSVSVRPSTRMLSSSASLADRGVLPDQHLRLAGIPEANGSADGAAGSHAALFRRAVIGRWSSDHATTRVVAGAGAGAGASAAALPDADAATAGAAWRGAAGSRRPTWSNEVFVPVGDVQDYAGCEEGQD